MTHESTCYSTSSMLQHASRNGTNSINLSSLQFLQHVLDFLDSVKDDTGMPFNRNGHMGGTVC